MKIIGKIKNIFSEGAQRPTSILGASQNRQTAEDEYQPANPCNPLLRRCLYIITSLIILYSPAFGQEILSFDFKANILKHPLTKNFDPITHRFKDTSSEFRNIASIDARLSQIASSISILQEQIDSHAATFETSKNDFFDDQFWGKISYKKKEITKLLNEQAYLSNQQMLGTHTSDLAILPMVKKIIQDILESVPAPNVLILNELPSLPCVPVQFFGGNPYLNFLNSGEKIYLQNYLSSSYSIGNLFSRVRTPVILNFLQKGTSTKE